MCITKERFTYPENFSANEMFKYCFGIITSTDKKPEEIILSFEAVQGKYIKIYPLHATQQLLVDNKEELRIKLTVHITHDLIMELLSYGDEVEVIAPKILRKSLRKIYSRALKNTE